jgi:VCBS repeat-containing protein
LSVAPAIDQTGKLTFVTAPDQVGSTEVVMRLTETGVSNPRQSAPQTFTITLTPVNDAPFLSLPESLDVNEDQGLVLVPNFAVDLGPGPVTALDEVGQTFTITTLALDPTLFVVQPTIDSSGTLRFRTRPDFNSSIAPALVTVQVTDDGSSVAPNVNRSELKTFTLAVAPINDPPSFTLTNANLVVSEDEEQFRGIPQSVFPDFASNIVVGPATAIDELSQNLTFSVTTDNPSLFSQQPAIDSKGQLTFVTAANRNGTAIAVVQLQDSGASSPAPNQNTSNRVTFTITVAPVNDAPEFSLVPAVSTQEDAGLQTVPAFASNIRRGPAGADDENSQQVSFEVIADDPSAFTIQPAISIDGTLSYQTAPNTNSANTNFGFNVRLRDNGLAAPPPNRNLSDAQTFVINVTPVNDPPVADSHSISGTEDTALVLSADTVLVGDVAGPTPDELSQLLRMTQVEGTTTMGGSVTPTFDPLDPSRIISMRYQPALHFVGIDTFRYVVTDNANPERSGTGTISITVQGVNDAPRFSRGTDPVADEDSGTISLANWATGIFAGPPSALDELASQTVSFSLTTNNASLFEVAPTVSSDGTLSFKPAKDANGVAQVVITAIDSGSGIAPNVNTSPLQTFAITINPVNDAPVFTPGGHVSVLEDSGPYAQPWASAIAAAQGITAMPATAADEITQSVSFEVLVDQPGLFAVQPSITGQGMLQFTPSADAAGVAILSIVAVDNGSGVLPNVNRSAPYLLTLTIDSQNDAPVANPDSYSTDEDTRLVVGAPGLLSNDTDVDFPGDSLSVVVENIVSDLGVSVTVNADGSMSYDPTSLPAFQQLTNGQSIADTFVYRIVDAAGARSLGATVTVTIRGVDDAPLAVNDVYSVGVGQSTPLDVLVNDSDVDSTIDPSSIVIKANPSFGRVSVNASGIITYTPEGGFRGNDVFRYTVKDTAGNESNEAAVSIVVNSAPVAGNDAAFTFKSLPVDINVLNNDQDIDGALDPATVQIEVSPAPNGTVEVLAGGVIRFTPAAGFSGDAQFSYSVRDNVGTPSNAATVNVRVQNSRWQNPQGNLDVNDDGFVSPIDVLLIINYLNGDGETFLPASGIIPQPYLDPTGDELVSPLDVLTVINFLNDNSQGGAGEGEGTAEGVEAGAGAGNLNNLLESAFSAYAMLLTPAQTIELSNEKLAHESVRLAIDDLATVDLPKRGVGQTSRPSSWTADQASISDEGDELLDLLSSEAEPVANSIDNAIDELFSQL